MELCSNMVDHIDEEIAYDEQAVDYDSNDSDAIDIKKKAVLRLKEKKLRVIELVMSSEDGRMWMYDFLGTNCHIFAENRLEGERSARFEGERAVGLKVLEEVMESSPEMFWKMRQEAVERERKS